MATKEGGTAFPAQFGFGGATTGMSLRDYFAAQALPALLIAFTANVQLGERVGETAYKIADAMIAAKEKSQ